MAPSFGLVSFIASHTVVVQASFSIMEKTNAVSSGDHTTEKSLAKCQARCTGDCTQFSFNTKSGHCFTSTDCAWTADTNPRVTSGCDMDRVQGCPQGTPTPPPAPRRRRRRTPTPTPTPPSPPTPPPAPRIPKWKVNGAPDTKKSLCGFKMLPASSANYTEVYHATKEVGTYNHAVMIDYFDGNLLLTWKNSPVDEDSAGQRILYSQSIDGETWTPSDGSNVLFPNVSTSSNPVALFAGPTAILNGRRYATASPHQFCLFPDPFQNLLLVRQVLPGVGNLGPIFWFAATIPAGFEETSDINGIVTSDQMPEQVQSDLGILNDWSQVPCSKEGNTLKCEACINGCDSNLRLGLGGGAEYTHYQVPNSAEEIILHRTKSHILDFTYRPNSSSSWTQQSATKIADARSNINAGPLPDGRIYMLSSACNKGRNPLVMSFTSDGWYWDQAIGVMSCEGLGQCGARAKGKSKSKGPAYPQGLTVTTPESMAGFYATASNNKEDIWVAKIPFDALPAKPLATTHVV